MRDSSAMHLTHRFTLDDQAEDRYPRLCFEIPAEAGSLEVVVSVSDPDAVVDLGCEGPAGWRGWSGGARSGFVVAADVATPGYLPGPLEPGEWAVVLGLHLLPHGWAEVTLEISWPATRLPEPEPVAQVQDRPRGSARRLPAPAGMTWWAGDLHAHTRHSDGSLSVDELAGTAVSSGLDFLAVTDHNTVSHHRHLPEAGARHQVTLLPGQEVTTHRGHANAFGPLPWIDFRRPADDWVREVHAGGGLLSINHPTDRDCSWLHPVTERPDAVEAFHISWARNLTATTTWGWLQTWGPTVLLGGSDFHRPDGGWRPGTPTTWVLAEEASPESLWAAVRAGRTAMSLGTRPDHSVDPFGSPVLLRLGDELRALAGDGCVLVDADGRRRVLHGDDITVAGWGRGPYRLEDPQRWVLAVCA